MIGGTYHCPFLENGRCTIYSERPAICRLWGASEALRCPYGCKPEEGWLTAHEGYIYLRTFEASKKG